MPGLKDWLAKASGDLKAAKKLIKDDDETLDNAAYNTHQCAEKALKTYLVFCRQPIPKTHDLENLLEFCAKKDASFKTLLDHAVGLNHYNLYSRYPDDRFFIDRQEVIEAIEKATKIFNFVRKKIEETTSSNLKLFEPKD